MTDEPPPSPADRPALRLIETELEPAGLSKAFARATQPALAAEALHRLIGQKDREHFAALLLNARHEITHAHIISSGTLTSSMVHPREVFKAAVLANAAAIIIGHNHPSGTLLPSPADGEVAERLQAAGELLGIAVLDSIIVGPGLRYFATSHGEERPLPQATPPRGRAPPRDAAALAEACRGLMDDIHEVLELQGEDWWDETVTAGLANRTRAEELLELDPYEPLTDLGAPQVREEAARFEHLIPHAMRGAIPALYATEEQEDPMVHVKLFTPWTQWSWYVTEFDGEQTCFGLVDGFEAELGYFDLEEIAGVEGPAGLRIERDEHFRPRRLSEVRRGLLPAPEPDGPTG